VWRFVSAQATGTSHLRADLSCQDRLACGELLDGVFVAVMADGAGSAAMGGLGAEVAVKVVFSHLERGLKEGHPDLAFLLREAAEFARQEVLAEAVQQGHEPRELASTLLALVVSGAGGGAMQIGDGVIVVSEGMEEWGWMFWPQRGEYANTTYFLTDADALTRLQVDTFSLVVTDAALMTDGLEPLALHYATKTVHDPFFKTMFHHVVTSPGDAELTELSSDLERFLLSDQVRSRTDDDSSLILATRRSQRTFQ